MLEKNRENKHGIIYTKINAPVFLCNIFYRIWFVIVRYSFRRFKMIQVQNMLDDV